MNVLRWGTNMIEGASPAGLIIAGAMLAVAFPPVRKTLRGAAVMATRGVLTAADTVKDSVAMMRGEVQDMVAEARGPLAGAAAATPTDGRRLIRGVRRRGRRMAVTAAAGALAMREGLQDIIAEARNSREASRQEESPTEATERVNPESRREPAVVVMADEVHMHQSGEPEAVISPSAGIKKTASRPARSKANIEKDNRL